MVKGLDGLHTLLTAIPANIHAEIVATLEKQAEKVVKDMRALAGVKTGRMRASIGWTWGDVPAGSVTVGKVAGRSYDRIAITIYAGARTGSKDDAFWARFQEFGTRKMAANPFFYPAYRANRQAMKSAITRAVSRAVKKAAT